MPYSGQYPMDQTQLLGVKKAPTTQVQQSGQPFTLYPDRTVITPIDGATFTSEGVTVVTYLSQQDASAIVELFNSAGIPCTIDRSGFLVLTATNNRPSASDPAVLVALGFALSNELREDGSLELREDGTPELRQN